MARVEARIALIGFDEDDAVSERIADVLLARRDDGRGEPTAPDLGASFQTALLEPTVIPLAKRQVEAHERWIEIVKLPEQSLVTVIEILSPSNKAGAGRSDYLAKRNELIDQETINLVEIDLLLEGSRMPMSRRLPPGDYYATVARAERRPDAEVYAWSVRRPLPAVPIPLHIPDRDIPLQLAEVVSTAYDRGGFSRAMRYGDPLPPTLPINPADRAWAEEHAKAR
jgi:hypothetical protein